MNKTLEVLPEPSLELGYHQKVADPRDGLCLFGPFDHDLSSRPTVISYGLVGTPSGCKAFSAFSERWQLPINSPDASKLWPMFPGFESVFKAQWPNTPTLMRDLDPSEIDKTARDSDPYARAGSIVKMYVDKIRQFEEILSNVVFEKT